MSCSSHFRSVLLIRPDTHGRMECTESSSTWSCLLHYMINIDDTNRQISPEKDFTRSTCTDTFAFSFGKTAQVYSQHDRASHTPREVHFVS